MSKNLVLSGFSQQTSSPTPDLPQSITTVSFGPNLFNVWKKYISLPEIEKVIYQKEYTIVVWADGERTVVKCCEEDFDKEKGLAMAIARRYIDRNKFKKLIKESSYQDK